MYHVVLTIQLCIDDVSCSRLDCSLSAHQLRVVDIARTEIQT